MKVNGVSQANGVKTHDSGDTVAAPGSSLVAVTVTSAVGWESRTTV